MPPTPFSNYSKKVKICLVILVIAVSLASIEPLEWSSYLLHQAGTLVCVIALLGAVKKMHISDKGVIGATAFLLTHILGAKYLYSYVPYNNWLLHGFGFDFNATFGFERNMYDRLVHFSYGLCLFRCFYEGFRHYFLRASHKQLVFLVLIFNMATSMLYELFEWLLAINLSAAEAENYNGQQGDVWDTHKDMACALVGGILASIGSFFSRDNLFKPTAKTKLRYL